jgi:hypothetical protein
MTTGHLRPADHAGMATPDMFSGLPALDPPRWPDVDLYEEVLALYDEWREEIAAVDEAYRRWSTSPTDEREDRFCAYIAALDQEEAAAGTYAVVAAELAASWSEQEDL